MKSKSKLKKAGSKPGKKSTKRTGPLRAGAKKRAAKKKAARKPVAPPVKMEEQHRVPTDVVSDLAAGLTKTDLTDENEATRREIEEQEALALDDQLPGSKQRESMPPLESPSNHDKDRDNQQPTTDDGGKAA